MIRLLTTLLFAVLGLSGVASHAQTVPPAGWTQVFREDFDTLTLQAPVDPVNPQAGFVLHPSPGWQSGYFFNNDARGMTFGGESAALVSGQYAWSPAFTPTTVSGGNLYIRMQKTPTALLPQLWAPYDWTSGVVTSKLWKEYPLPVYFESWEQLPKGRGMWPAFWLINGADGRQLEVDIMEAEGQSHFSYWVSLHWNDTPGGPLTHWTQRIDTAKDLTAAGHSYSVLIMCDFITFYLDRVKVASVATPAPFLTGRWYMVHNLSMGGAGTFAGPPDASTAAANLRVDFTKVWKPAG